MGYTQEEFAEKVGIGHSTLKKYIGGHVAYSYEMLDIFATELQCSYDYLLGKSKSPVREHHEITEQTRLSEKAINKIVRNSQRFDEDGTAKWFVKTLNLIIEEDGIVESISNFWLYGKTFSNIQNTIVMQGMELLNQIVIDKGYPNGINGMDKIEYMGISYETVFLIDLATKLKEVKPRIIEMMNNELAENNKSLSDIAKELQKIFSQTRGTIE